MNTFPFDTRHSIFSNATCGQINGRQRNLKFMPAGEKGKKQERKKGGKGNHKMEKSDSIIVDVLGKILISVEYLPHIKNFIS